MLLGSLSSSLRFAWAKLSSHKSSVWCLDEVLKFHHPKFRTYLNQLEVEITLTSLQFTKNSRLRHLLSIPLGKFVVLRYSSQKLPQRWSSSRWYPTKRMATKKVKWLFVLKGSVHHKHLECIENLNIYNDSNYNYSHPRAPPPLTRNRIFRGSQSQRPGINRFLSRVFLTGEKKTWPNP